MAAFFIAIKQANYYNSHTAWQLLWQQVTGDIEPLVGRVSFGSNPRRSSHLLADRQKRQDTHR